MKTFIANIKKQIPVNTIEDRINEVETVVVTAGSLISATRKAKRYADSLKCKASIEEVFPAKTI